VKITKGKLQQIISEEVQKFIEKMQQDLLKEGNVSAEDLRSLLEELDQRDGDKQR
tara:strand:+ start:634 stop:798 length:165 start_codon:yes stop_codon:yes gene_type:complete